MRGVRAAQDILLKSESEWDRLRPKMQVASDAEFQGMKKVYREGALLHRGRKNVKLRPSFFLCSQAWAMRRRFGKMSSSTRQYSGALWFISPGRFHWSCSAARGKIRVPR